MTIRDLFFGKNALKIRKFCNEEKILEVRYVSRSIKLLATQSDDGRSYIIDFEEENYPNFFDEREKRKFIELICGGQCCVEGLDTSIRLFFTESELDEELEESKEDVCTCLTLQENRLRDYRIDFIFFDDGLEEIKRKFF